MRKTIIVLVSIVILIGLAYAWSSKHAEAPKSIGGDRDEHGCLIGGGYSFNTEVGACLREFEMTADIKRAAKLAVESVGPSYGLTVASFNSYEEPGAYDITLSDPVQNQRKTISIKNWKVETTQ